MIDVNEWWENIIKKIRADEWYEKITKTLHNKEVPMFYYLFMSGAGDIDDSGRLTFDATFCCLVAPIPVNGSPVEFETLVSETLAADFVYLCQCKKEDYDRLVALEKYTCIEIKFEASAPAEES